LLIEGAAHELHDIKKIINNHNIFFIIAP